MISLQLVHMIKMDILISSNLERLIFKIAGDDAEKNAELMKSLVSTGKYDITPKMQEELNDFVGGYASEADTAKTIKALYQSDDYVIDTHTAVAVSVYNEYKKDTDDTTKTLIVSTASPYKFTRSVMDAIDESYNTMSDFELVDELSKISKINVPQAIEDIRTAPILHSRICDADQMKNTVEKILGI